MIDQALLKILKANAEKDKTRHLMRVELRFANGDTIITSVLDEKEISDSSEWGKNIFIHSDLKKVPFEIYKMRRRPT